MKRLVFVIGLLLAAGPAWAGEKCNEADLIGLGINDQQASALGCDSLDASLVPGTTATYNIGSSAKKWNIIYAGTIDSATCTGLSANIDFTAAGLAVVDTSGTSAGDLCVGIETGCSATTGAAVHVHGISDVTVGEQGLLDLLSGNVADADADIHLTTGHADGDIEFSNPTGVEWSIDSTNGNVVQGAQGGNITLLTTDTGVVATGDAVILKVCGGSDDTAASGAFIALSGDDAGGADTGAGAVFNVGNNTAAKLSVVHNSTETFAVNSSGATIGNASTLRKDVGTIVAAGGNQGAAEAIVDQVTYVSASDNAKGVRLPVGAAAIIGAGYTIYNTVASKALLVYPGTGGNINAVGANTAITIYGLNGVSCEYVVADTWNCGLMTTPKLRSLFVPAGLGRRGTTATVGWVNTTTNINEATLAQSATADTFTIPIAGLQLNDTIVSFKVIGQIESGGNTVTVDADLRMLTNAAADPADSSLGAITQVSKTADYAIVDTKALATVEVVSTGDMPYLFVTATTGGTTDIRLLGVEINVWRE